eukprot:365939-Chlamydomonas_euryale.AAC.2
MRILNLTAHVCLTCNAACGVDRMAPITTHHTSHITCTGCRCPQRLAVSWLARGCSGGLAICGVARRRRRRRGTHRVPTGRGWLVLAFGGGGGRHAADADGVRSGHRLRRWASLCECVLLFGLCMRTWEAACKRGRLQHTQVVWGLHAGVGKLSVLVYNITPAGTSVAPRAVHQFGRSRVRLQDVRLHATGRLS